MSIDFLGIGAQKAGTTWLFNRLSNLEGVSLPSIKEFHFFNQNHIDNYPRYRGDSKAFERISTRVWWARVGKEIPIFHGDLNFHDNYWYLKWHLSKHTKELYAEIFDYYGSRGVTGEITPAYSMLGTDEIESIYRDFPDLKLIMMIRDPIERAWSQLRFSHMDQLSNQDFIYQFINSSSQRKRSAYLHTITSFRSVFPKNRLLIGFYDAISTDPRGLLSDVCNFLELSSNSDLRHLDSKDNVSVPAKLTDKVYGWLKDYFEYEIRRLSKDLDSYATQWCNRHYGISSEPKILNTILI